MMNLETMETVLLILLVTDAIALGVLVLLQQGKGADIGASFGSGSANTLLGSSGSATFLTRLTTWLAVGFFAVSFGLAYIAKEKAVNLQGIGIPDLEQAIKDQEARNLETGTQGDDLALPDDLPLAEDLLDDASELESELTPDTQGVDSDVPDL